MRAAQHAEPTALGLIWGQAGYALVQSEACAGVGVDVPPRFRWLDIALSARPKGKEYVYPVKAGYEAVRAPQLLEYGKDAAMLWLEGRVKGRVTRVRIAHTKGSAAPEGACRQATGAPGRRVAMVEPESEAGQPSPGAMLEGATGGRIHDRGDDAESVPLQIVLPLGLPRLTRWACTRRGDGHG